MAERTLSRRTLLQGAVAVAAFNPVSRSWATTLELGSVPLPPLQGQLLTDAATRTAAAEDFGHILHRTPWAVLVPGSVEDIVAMVGFARAQGLKLAAARGLGESHSTYMTSPRWRPASSSICPRSRASTRSARRAPGWTRVSGGASCWRARFPPARAPDAHRLHRPEHRWDAVGGGIGGQAAHRRSSHPGDRGGPRAEEPGHLRETHRHRRKALPRGCSPAERRRLAPPAAPLLEALRAGKAALRPGRHPHAGPGHLLRVQQAARHR